MKRLLLYICVASLAVASSSGQSAGSAGAFARLGFGARGMGMGNAQSAVTSGAVSTYYNPALSPFAEQRTGMATFGILSFDRYLNFLSFTMPLPPHAGVSVGLINAGVRNIDGRDDDGFHTEDYSTSENQFYLSFANRVDEHVSLGVTIKLYYSKLFEDVKSTTVGFDAGLLVQLTDDLSAAAVLQDLNSKYRWDTKAIYGQSGKQSDDRFPNLRRIALAYKLPQSLGIVDVELENSSEKTNILRVGAEYFLAEQFTIRAGADRVEASSFATGIKPTFGFTIKNPLSGWTPAVHYAYVVEGFAPHGMHIITVTGTF